MIVLDACSAVEIVLDTPEGSGLMNMMLKNEKIIASELFRAEVRNSFFKYVRAGRMTKEQADTNIAIAEGLVEQFVPLEENVNEALVAACQYNHSVYDMLYLTLARRYNATLYTLDKRLQQKCIEARVNCIQLVDLQSGE